MSSLDVMEDPFVTINVGGHLFTQVLSVFCQSKYLEALLVNASSNNEGSKETIVINRSAHRFQKLLDCLIDKRYCSQTIYEDIEFEVDYFAIKFDIRSLCILPKPKLTLLNEHKNIKIVGADVILLMEKGKDVQLFQNIIIMVTYNSDRYNCEYDFLDKVYKINFPIVIIPSENVLVKNHPGACRLATFRLATKNLNARIFCTNQH